jgi:hypothetical protein
MAAGPVVCGATAVECKGSRTQVTAGLAAGGNSNCCYNNMDGNQYCLHCDNGCRDVPGPDPGRKDGSPHKTVGCANKKWPAFITACICRNCCSLCGNFKGEQNNGLGRKGAVVKAFNAEK